MLLFTGHCASVTKFTHGADSCAVYLSPSYKPTCHLTKVKRGSKPTKMKL